MYSNFEPYFPDRKPPMGSIPNPYLPINQGLVLNSIMWEGAGDTVEDLSGNGNSFTRASGTVSWVPRTYGSAIDFSSLYFTADNFNQLNVDYVTIVAGFIPDTDHDGAIWDKPFTAHSAPFYQYSLFTFDGAANSVIFNYSVGGNRNFCIAEGDMVLGVHNQYIATWNGTTAKIYRNGVQLTIDTSSSTDTGVLDKYATTPAIGRLKNVASLPFDGKIEYIYIYNRALSASEKILLSLEPFIGFRWESLIELQAFFEEPAPSGNPWYYYAQAG